MKPTNCKIISDAFTRALLKEDLHSRDAAKKLNFHPCYISMIQNEKSWESISNSAWQRFQEWYSSSLPINEFVIPAGEPIWQPIEKKENKKEESEKVVISTLKHQPKLKDKASVKRELKEVKRPEFDYSFLNNKDFMNFKEKEAEFMDSIGKGIEKIMKQFNTPAAVSRVDSIRQNIAIDIEINLVVNGQKINI